MEFSQSQFREFIKFAILPIVFLAAVLLGRLLWQVFDLSDNDYVIKVASNYYAAYGYWVVLIGALAEGFLFLNWYVPGSIVVVMGVVFASQNNQNVFLIVGIIILGFFITSIINYVLGRFGWYHVFMKLGLKQPLERVKSRVKNKGLPIIFSTYFHPNIGALTSTSAGILQLNFAKFVLYSILALMVWNSVWGVVVYFIGSVVLKYMGFLLMPMFAVGWLIFSGVRFSKKTKTMRCLKMFHSIQCLKREKWVKRGTNEVKREIKIL